MRLTHLGFGLGIVAVFPISVRPTSVNFFYSSGELAQRPQRCVQGGPTGRDVAQGIVQSLRGTYVRTLSVDEYTYVRT